MIYCFFNNKFLCFMFIGTIVIIDIVSNIKYKNYLLLYYEMLEIT